MGDFRFTLEAAGGHCCGDQNVKPGEVANAYGCGQYSCPDCKARRMVKELVDAGYTIHVAKIEHWPADMTVDGRTMNYTESGQVTDDIKAGISYAETTHMAFLGAAQRRRGK